MINNLQIQFSNNNKVNKKLVPIPNIPLFLHKIYHLIHMKYSYYGGKGRYKKVLLFGQNKCFYCGTWDDKSLVIFLHCSTLLSGTSANSEGIKHLEKSTLHENLRNLRPSTMYHLNNLLIDLVYNYLIEELTRWLRANSVCLKNCIRSYERTYKILIRHIW